MKMGLFKVNLLCIIFICITKTHVLLRNWIACDKTVYPSQCPSKNRKITISYHQSLLLCEYTFHNFISDQRQQNYKNELYYIQNKIIIKEILYGGRQKKIKNN